MSDTNRTVSTRRSGRGAIVGAVVGLVATLGACATAEETESSADELTSLAGGGVVAPKLQSIESRCKLISDRFVDDPTPNQTHLRANVRGTDLGIPVVSGDDIFFLFGDTAGARGIWPLGAESMPEAVGFASYDAVKKDPSRLCEDLQFLRVPAESSMGRSLDPRIESDFAVAWMNPPAGHTIDEYIHNPAGPYGANAFPNIPGDFEVPSGAFTHGGSMYIFYTTVASATDVTMKGSYLARWKSPSRSAFPVYDILYKVDERESDSVLGGNFVNVAPVVRGEYVYLFGTGHYRQSDVHLARKRLSSIAKDGGFERYDAATRTWRAAKNDAKSVAPIVDSQGIGEVSVRYFPEIDGFAMLDQEFIGDQNQLVARFARTPEGPWTSAITVASLSRPQFTSKFCCHNGNCSGQRIMNCDRAGYYGAFMLPDVQRKAKGTFAIDFVVSTWDPYNVALMSATFTE